MNDSCMRNIETIIKNHNKKLINNNRINKDEPCRCRKKQTCPLEGAECKAEYLIYQATIKTEHSTKNIHWTKCQSAKKNV